MAEGAVRCIFLIDVANKSTTRRCLRRPRGDTACRVHSPVGCTVPPLVCTTVRSPKRWRFYNTTAVWTDTAAAWADATVWTDTAAAWADATVLQCDGGLDGHGGLQYNDGLDGHGGLQNDGGLDGHGTPCPCFSISLLFHNFSCDTPAFFPPRSSNLASQKTTPPFAKKKPSSSPIPSIV